MRKILLFLSSIVCFVGLAKADPKVMESPWSSYGTPTTVSISSSAWTAVPTTSSLSGRRAILVSIPASASASDFAHIGGCTSTDVATTVRPMELTKGGFYTLPLGDRDCLWVMTLHTSAQNLHVQEVK